MCGIVGEYRFDARPIDTRKLCCQVEMLKHRGPDAQNIWVNGTVGLGHTRLAIIDLSPAGHQPMCSPDGQYVLIYNGEVYNFRTLKRSLRHNYTFRGTSDTEVLLYAFMDYGPAIFDKLEGMFAFAIYEQTSGQLWLVRDGFGIKPLYYHRNRNRLVFASEIKPLLLDSETPRRPNYHALRQHVLFGYAADPQTAFEDIFRLSPGHYMQVKPDGTIHIGQYWGIEQLLTCSVSDLLETLQESVVLHSISDAPTGLLLSSGLDSSMILSCLARKHQVAPDFKAYNVGMDASDPVDAPMSKMERKVASRTCDYFHVPFVKIHPLASENIPLSEIVKSVEEPICNPSNNMIDLVCAAARQNGTKVLLSGHGGDEIFAGYRRQVWVRYMHWLRMPGVSNLVSAVCQMTGNHLLQRMGASLCSRELHPLISIASVGWALIANHNISPDWFPSNQIEEAAAPLSEMLHKWRSLSLLKQMMLLDMRTYLSAQNLINMDKSSMRRSVEVRVPYLYRPLVAIGLQTPDSILISHFRNKALIREVAKQALPDFLWRVPKLGFGPPQSQMIANEEARELLLGQRTRDRGLFRMEIVRKLFEAFKAGSEHLAMQLYSMVIVEQWFRLFIDSSPVDSQVNDCSFGKLRDWRL